MKTNYNVKIENDNVVLIPYQSHHVNKYHEWMKSSELQELTASEPLSLNDEFLMQESWMNDPDKCTFIIMDKETLFRTSSEIEAMIGDTNLFLKSENTAEIEIMIAEKKFRGQKRGWNSITAMIKYGIEKLNIRNFFAKIKSDNLPSILLFKKLKFLSDEKPNVFNELTFYLEVNEFYKIWINSLVEKYRILVYDNI